MATSGGQSSDSEWFDVSDSPDTAVEDPAFQSMNVCRVSALSLMLGNDGDGVRELASELEALGFSERLREGLWNQDDADPIRSFSGVPDRRLGDRILRWQMVGETAHPKEMVTFLVEVLGSRLERESVAAAAALWRHTSAIDSPPLWWLARRSFPPGFPESIGERWWREAMWRLPDPLDFADSVGDQDVLAWDGDEWKSIYQAVLRPVYDAVDASVAVRGLAAVNVARALRSPDPVARSLALSVFSATEYPSDAVPTVASAPVLGGAHVSAMIHGTWGWKGDWWRPQGAFHSFVLNSMRSNLFDRLGTKFSWSGAYRESHRAQAATDFCDWSREVAPAGLETVFAHSYGGDVASRAALEGASIGELVLLSTPVTDSVDRATNAGIRVIDVRLRFDSVLALARRGQRLRPGPNVTEVLLERWRLDHAATHNPSVWLEEGVAQRAGIVPT